MLLMHLRLEAGMGRGLDAAALIDDEAHAGPEHVDSGAAQRHVAAHRHGIHCTAQQGVIAEVANPQCSWVATYRDCAGPQSCRTCIVQLWR